MTREEIYRDIEDTLGLVPTFVKSIPEEYLEAEWDLLKRLQLGETHIPNKYKELMGVALSANVLGPRSIGTENLNVFSLYWWFNRAYRCHPMPFQLEGFKMAERTEMNYRRLFVAICVATVVGMIAAFAVILYLLYDNGAAQKIAPPNVALVFGMEPWTRMDGWVKAPQPGDLNRAVAIGVGFAITLVLNSLRMRLGWFPFHPVGYAVSSTWSMQQLWLPMLIAWIIKLTVLRYGGLRLYQRALPLFLGVILGECVVGSLWTIIGPALNLPATYAFWP